MASELGATAAIDSTSSLSLHQESSSSLQAATITTSASTSASSSTVASTMFNSLTTNFFFSPTSIIEDFFRTRGDKRVAELRFMDNPWEVLFISAFYVYFCYDLGPRRLMRNRKPFDLVWTVRAFNTSILLFNIYLLYRHFALLNWGLDCIGCSPVSETDFSPKALEHISICHIFLYSRILELIDTLWICLRKKNRQITFLHVFHHSFVLLMTWFYIKFAPGGSTAMFPIVNGLVHTIMYIYYILSTFDSMKPYLWWKKYVTTIQLIQFIILGVHFAVAALTPNCGYPRTLSMTGVAIACLFFGLFAAFYRQTYNISNCGGSTSTPTKTISTTTTTTTTTTKTSTSSHNNNNNHNHISNNNNHMNNNNNNNCNYNNKKDV